MRLFVAVEIDDHTRAQLRAAQEAIQSMIARARVPPRVTWVRPDSAHVTVRFIGETPDAMLPRIQEALDRLVLIPFTVTWQTLGTFGSGRNPRVIWIGLAEVSAEFDELDRRVNACLDAVIGPEPPRAFTPHLTLGRVKVPGKAVPWAEALAAVRFEPGHTRVERVTLYRSRLSSKGPTYTALSSHG